MEPCQSHQFVAIGLRRTARGQPRGPLTAGTAAVSDRESTTPTRDLVHSVLGTPMTRPSKTFHSPDAERVLCRTRLRAADAVERFGGGPLESAIHARATGPDAATKTCETGGVRNGDERRRDKKASQLNASCPTKRQLPTKLQLP